MFRARKLPPQPQEIGSAVIPEELAVTERGSTFIQHFNRDSGMLVLSSDEQLAQFTECRILFMDGTFKTTPRLWSQLYIIKGQLRENENILLAAILLKSKTQETYKAMFRTIKSLIMQKTGMALSPAIIMSDFESGLQPAVREEFPQTSHKGCFFHYTQAIYRFVQTSHLIQYFYFSIMLIILIFKTIQC